MVDLEVREGKRLFENDNCISEYDILCLKDIYKILPFGEKKIRKLIQNHELPVTKIGKDYITTRRKLTEWIEDNIFQELYY